MKIEETPLKDCYILVFPVHSDARGHFMRSFDRSAFSSIGINAIIDHTAEAFNLAPYTLRGMHFQLNPHPEAKLVRCMSGAAFDVVVDLRRGSPSYKHWFGTSLTGDESHKALLVPAGFAHGYLTLTANTTLSYHLFAPYHAELQRGIRYDDPEIGIQWPASPQVIGERDKALPLLSEYDPQFEMQSA